MNDKILNQGSVPQQYGSVKMVETAWAAPGKAGSAQGTADGKYSTQADCELLIQAVVRKMYPVLWEMIVTPHFFILRTETKDSTWYWFLHRGRIAKER